MASSILLPEQYSGLLREPAPLMLLEAIKLYGTKEKTGSGNNPVIMSWAKEIGVENDYTADSIPWCGLFMGVVAHRALKPLPPSPLWALSWREFGTRQEIAELGDILVFRRDGGGHVGMYVAEDKECYHVLGGNQGDAVSIVPIRKQRCVGVQRYYKIGKPVNVRRIFVTSGGSISTNER